MQYEFDKEEKYKLFRTIKEILHPTISKKNISDYKIIISEELLPLRIFYPKKVTNLSNVMIYIHGDGKLTSCEGKYSDIASSFATELDQLVISMEYENYNNIEDINKITKKTFTYIYNELIKANIHSENITLVSDSNASIYTINIVEKMNKQEIKIKNLILFYPVLSGEYYGKTSFESINANDKVDYNLITKLQDFFGKKPQKRIFPLNKEITYPRTLIITGNVDPLIDEAKYLTNQNPNVSIYMPSFSNHGFLNTRDKDVKDDYFDKLKQFLKDKDN